MEFISRFNVVHEVVRMKVFMYSLKDHAHDWLYDCGLRDTSSFVVLIKAFHKEEDVSNPTKMKYKEVVEHLAKAPHVSMEDHVYHEEADHNNDDMHLHEDIPITIIMDSKDKGLVTHWPFQISELNDKTLNDLERKVFVEKPLEGDLF